MPIIIEASCPQAERNFHKNVSLAKPNTPDINLSGWKARSETAVLPVQSRIWAARPMEYEISVAARLDDCR